MTLSITVTDDMLRQALLDFIALAVDGEVVAGQDNRVAQPTGNYYVLQTLWSKGLSTNKETWNPNAQTVDNSRDTEWCCQVDVYGEGAADRANILATLCKTQWAADQFATGGVLAPLFATDPLQTTMINAEEQYEDRYTFEFHAQFNPVVTTPGQFANVLKIIPVDVDVRFPPET